MRVNLKGVASATKVLATGEKVTYYYAWRGGPRLRHEPGSPEFILGYERALSERRLPDSSVFKSIIADYLTSADFTCLRERTKADYQKHIATIEVAFGDLPTPALTDPKVTGEFLRWRDSIGGRQGDYAWSVLMLILAHGRTVGMTSYRPPGHIKRLYEADRSDKIWEANHIDAFMAVAPEPLQWALVFATETAQRQGDLLRLPWSSFDGEHIRLTPSKSITRKKPKGRLAKIPISSLLRGVIEKLPRVSPVMLTNGRGRPWHGNSFRKAWGAATTKSGVVGLTFHDLRGTAVTRLSEDGCSPQEIATYTGWSLRDVQTMLDRYLARTDKLRSSALEKLERARR